MKISTLYAAAAVLLSAVPCAFSAEVQLRGAIADNDDCPEDESFIPGMGCRPAPEGPRPRCSNGRRAVRACYRPKSSWWQCERDCGLGPPNSKQGRRNRRDTPPSADYEEEEEVVGLNIA